MSFEFPGVPAVGNDGAQGEDEVVDVLHVEVVRGHRVRHGVPPIQNYRPDGLVALAIVTMDGFFIHMFLSQYLKLVGGPGPPL